MYLYEFIANICQQKQNSLSVCQCQYEVLSWDGMGWGSLVSLLASGEISATQYIEVTVVS